MKKKLTRRKINSERNSVSTARLSDLDFDNWWTDGNFNTYLHVRHKSDGTVHRVWNKKGDICEDTRIEMCNGKLMWLYREKE